MNTTSCPICGDTGCLGNECSAPLDEWETGGCDEVHVIQSAVAGNKCEKCNSWMHESEQKYGCIMCQVESLHLDTPHIM